MIIKLQNYYSASDANDHGDKLSDQKVGWLVKIT
jgi:hypothetical protein